MRLLAEILMLPVTGPLRGLRFIAEQVQAEMDAALMDEGQLEAELITLSLRHDRGQIGGAEYEAEEARLLHQLDAIRGYEVALMEEYQDAYEGEAWQDLPAAPNTEGVWQDLPAQPDTEASPEAEEDGKHE